MFYTHNGQEYLLNLIDTPVSFQLSQTALFSKIIEHILRSLLGSCRFQLWSITVDVSLSRGYFTCRRKPSIEISHRHLLTVLSSHILWICTGYSSANSRQFLFGVQWEPAHHSCPQQNRLEFGSTRRGDATTRKCLRVRRIRNLTSKCHLHAAFSAQNNNISIF